MTEKGLRQAQRLAEGVSWHTLTKIVTSSLKRSMETVSRANHGISVSAGCLQREMSLGCWRANCAGGLNQGLQRLLDQWTQDKVHSGFQVVNTCLMFRNECSRSLSQFLQTTLTARFSSLGIAIRISCYERLMGWN